MKHIVDDNDDNVIPGSISENAMIDLKFKLIDVYHSN